MQRIERYGVIALVLLLVTILAVSLWGERKNGGGILSVFKRDKKTVEEQVAQAPAAPAPNEIITGERQPERPPVGTDAPWQAPQNDQSIVLGKPQGPAQEGDPSSISPLPPETVPAEIPVPQPEYAPLNPSSTKPPVARGNTYVVKHGETLGLIAQRELGSAKRWTEIQALNGNIDPKRVSAGMTLKLPAGASSAKSGPAKAPARPTAPASSGRTYVVRNGDSLSRIAQSQLGDGERWRDIAALNPGMNPDRLRVGASLTLPAGAPAAKAKSAPDARNETVAVAGWSQPRSNGGSTPRVR